MKGCLKTLRAGTLSLGLFLVGCGNSFESGTNLLSRNFCTAYPNEPECNGGVGGNGSQLTYITPSADGTIRMVRSNLNNPGLGDGYAKIDLKNISTQTLTGTFSIDQGGNNLPITVLEICLRLNELATTCSASGNSQISFSILPGTTGAFLARVQADGTIPFVPVVNAVYVRTTASDVVQNTTLKIPIANE
ncbi:MAG: hypothetical protein A4S09_10300 [Proteobacteria bacterium SG_bin7]|nr:MAG: hypothetical protein A4S09_10300 [Proteobacteria bacterium SG_bin7]